MNVSIVSCKSIINCAKTIKSISFSRQHKISFDAMNSDSDISLRDVYGDSFTVMLFPSSSSTIQMKK